MGRRRKFDPAIDNVKTLVKNNTDWEQLVNTLTKIAIGGYEFENYNKQRIIAQPNLSAMELLLEIAWGKMDTNNDEEEVRNALNSFKKFSAGLSLPPKPSDSKQNNTQHGTDMMQ